VTKIGDLRFSFTPAAAATAQSFALAPAGPDGSVGFAPIGSRAFRKTPTKAP
jgi:hypothetical protein